MRQRGEPPPLDLLKAMAPRRRKISSPRNMTVIFNAILSAARNRRRARHRASIPATVNINLDAAHIAGVDDGI